MGGSAGRGSALPGCSVASFPPWQLAQPASQVPARENLVHKASLELGQGKVRLANWQDASAHFPASHSHTRVATLCTESKQDQKYKQGTDPSRSHDLDPIDKQQLKPRLSWLISR